MGKQQTGKKVKVVGTEQYINARTGEIEEFVVTDVQERDFNFTKVWMRNFLATLELVGNAKTKVAYWVVDHVTKENMLPYTYRQIVTATGLSLDTVSATMSVLQEALFLKKLNAGCYIVNPDIVFKGARTERLNALTTFHETAIEEPSLEKQLQNLLATIQTLTRKAEQLSAKIKQESENLGEQVLMNGETEQVKAS